MKKVDSKFVIFLIFSIFVISIIWWTLELAFYGEIQSRIVDDCISLCWIGVICFAYKFKDFERKKRLQKYNKETTTWRLRTPPVSSMYNNEFADKIWLPSEYENGHRSDLK